MSENRFKSTIDEDTMSIMPYLVVDREECFYNLQGCVDLLNEQQATISRLEEKNGALKKFIKDNFDEMMDSKMVIDDEL